MTDTRTEDMHGEDIPTPRTDAWEREYNAVTLRDSCLKSDLPSDPWRRCRQLERELAKANKRAAHWEESFHNLVHTAPSATPTSNKVLCPYCNPLLTAAAPMVPNGEYQTLAVGGSSAPSSIAAPFAYYCPWNGTFHRENEITAEQRARFTPLYNAPVSATLTSKEPK
jgi:hypothetical protein